MPEVADSAPALIDINSVSVNSAPIGAYVVPEDADALLKAFLSEANDVARDSEVVRCAHAWANILSKNENASSCPDSIIPLQNPLMLQAEPLRALEPSFRSADGGRQETVSQGAEATAPGILRERVLWCCVCDVLTLVCFPHCSCRSWCTQTSASTSEHATRSKVRLSQRCLSVVGRHFLTRAPRFQCWGKRRRCLWTRSSWPTSLLTWHGRRVRCLPPAAWR